MKTAESQLFGTNGPYQSASITYRVEQTIPPRATDGTNWARFLKLPAAGAAAERRVTMLAVRYPHPAGRAGYARLECVVAALPDGEAPSPGLPGWLDQLGKLADDGLPGISMAQGVREAMGLDVPIGELSEVLARLEASAASGPVASAASDGRQVVQVSYELNGAAHPQRHRRVAELDRLIARVRRDGSVISHSASVVSLMEPSLAAPPASPAAVPTMSNTPTEPAIEVPIAGNGAIQAVSFSEAAPPSDPTVRRLPAVAAP